MHIPTTYSDFKSHWRQHQQAELDRYGKAAFAFVPNLLPELALQLDSRTLLRILHQRLGNELFEALNPNKPYPSPLIRETSTDWMKTTNMVGINIRTIDNFWNVIKYALTIPDCQQSIHLLPIWEPGVVASLYGMSSWNINPEFFSEELANILPALDTVEAQLKVVINVLHAMGKVVGMDVIPHTDRYAQIVLANPSHFEWLRRKDLNIIDHSANLHETVQRVIMRYLAIFGGSALKKYPAATDVFFSLAFPEEERLRVLFGEHRDQWGRMKRRNQLVQFLYDEGLEPVPATMAPPYRGLEVDSDPDAKTIDLNGRIWRDYKIAEPQEMSRVFGPLTRYKLYDRLENNQFWQIDFDSPRKEVWNYVCEKYSTVQSTYNFDFMRGDMSHVQMRPDGVPEKTGEFYDIHKTIKGYIQAEKKYFAYFAESFLAPPNLMGYGDEVEHLIQSSAETTLGDLQSMVVGSERFVSEIARYHKLVRTQPMVPCFTIMTADKDDPRFDKFYLKGNEVRLFCGLFLTDMPSYMGLGFEVRDPHPEPVANEYYTKLFVFTITSGPKATQGKYIWGSNALLFHNLTRIRLFADKIMDQIDKQAVQWLVAPDETGKEKLIVWVIKQYVFLASFDTENNTDISSFELDRDFQVIFSTIDESLDTKVLQAGEGRIYERKTQ